MTSLQATLQFRRWCTSALPTCFHSCLASLPEMFSQVPSYLYDERFPWWNEAQRSQLPVVGLEA